MADRRRRLGVLPRKRCRDRLAVVARRQRERRPHRGGRTDERRTDHRPARRVPRARPGRAALPDPVARAAGRVRPAHRLAPLQRLALPRPRDRPRRVLRLGLRAARPLLARQGDLDAARERHLSRDDHGHRRDRAVDRRRRQLGRDREAAAPLRGLVCRAFHRVRGDRARLVPPDPDRQRARSRHRRGRLLARPVRGGARLPRRLPRGAAARQRAALPPPSRVGGVRGGRRRLRADHRARARPSRRPAGPVLPLAVPRPGALVGRASLLSLRRARRAQPQDHGQGARRLLRRPRHRGSGHARRRGGAARPLHRGRAAARRGGADRRRHRHHARARARGADGRRRRAPLPRPRARRTSSSAKSSRRSRRTAASGSSSSSATTRPPRARGCSHPTTCGSSSPISTTATCTSAGRRR